jgi:hypothetical protein
MVKETKPSFVFLIETISTKKRLEMIRIKMGFVGLFVVDPVGRSGGLALFWMEECGLEIYNFSRRHINAILKSSDDNFVWKFTGFYGNPESAKREESWSLLGHSFIHHKKEKKKKKRVFFNNIFIYSIFYIKINYIMYYN